MKPKFLNQFIQIGFASLFQSLPAVCDARKKITIGI